MTSRRNGGELEIAVAPSHPALPLYLEFLKVPLGRDLNPLHGIEIEVINGQDAAKSPYAAVFADHEDPRGRRISYSRTARSRRASASNSLGPSSPGT